MKKPINLNRLRAFVAIAREGSFGRAAERLGVSQPTLSLQLAQLEEAYGVRLVERPARPLGLTATGRDLLALCAPLVVVETQALELLEGAAQLERGHLRIAADAPQHVLEGMAMFSQEHPGVELELLTGNSAQVLELLLQHRADVAVVADADKSATIHRQVLHRDRVVLVVDRAHPWAKRRHVHIEALAEQVLIEREQGSRTRAIVRRALASSGVSPRGSLVLTGREAVLRAARLGLGVGCVFESELDDRRLRGVRLRGAEMGAVEYVVCRRTRRHEVAIAAFSEAVRRCQPARG